VPNSLLGSLSFETPLGGIVALVVAVPLAAAALASVRAARGRKLLQLTPPSRRSRLALALVVAAPLLLALAASGPALSSHAERHVRTDAQAMFVFDISRSMLASASVRSPDRLDEARSAAIRLRDRGIPDVPSGISTLTTILLPHLFPTSNLAVFNSGARDAVAIESPPPPAVAVGFPGTSFSALTPLRTQGYFSPGTRKRIVVLLTDGEAGPYEPQAVADSLVGNDSGGSSLIGVPSGPSQAPVSLFIVRVGDSADRIYHGNGSVEAAYRPDPRAPEIVSTLATLSHGYTFDASQLGSATKQLRRVLGSGPTVVEGTRPQSFALGPYVMLLALAALAGVLWLRNRVAL
jgi:hypothetical protein